MQEQKSSRAAQQQSVHNDDHEADEIDLLELLRTIWRGKLLILFATFVTLIIGFLYAFVLAVPMYSASTTLALQIRDQQLVDLQSVMSGVSTESEAMNTELEVIRSRGLLEKVVRQLELTEDPEFNPDLRPDPIISVGDIIEQVQTLLGQVPRSDVRRPNHDLNVAVDLLRDAISASVQRSTYVFNITVTTQDPIKSMEIVNTLAELYINDQVEVKFNATENAVVWLSDRVVDLEVELQEREDAIKSKQSGSDFVSVEGLEALNLQLREARQRLMQQMADENRARAALDVFVSARASNDVGVMLEAAGDATLNRVASQLDEERALDEGSAFLTRFGLLQSRAEAELQRSQAQVAALEGALERLEQRISAQSGELIELQKMQRELDATAILYETFLTRLKETTVQQGIQQADARVLSQSIRGEMVAPRKMMILALSTILGLMAGVGIVLLYEATRRGFRTTDTLESATGYPVVGQIPRIPIRKRGDLLDYLNNKPTSAAAEAIRNLRTSILLSNIDKPPQVIMSTSSIPGEGKTTQSIALAHNLASMGKKVLLLEGDVRRRTFGQYFAAGPVSGLLSVLSGRVDLENAVYHSEKLQGDVLMGEKSSVNAADLFASERFGAFIDHLRGLYDYIIIDSPPVLVVPDARLLGQHADTVIYSVEWDSTSKSQVIDGLQELSRVNVPVTGTVLAQIDPKGMKRYGYGGRYGAYSRYGGKYYQN